MVPNTYISYANMVFNIPLGVVSPNANIILHLGCVSSNSYILSCVSYNSYILSCVSSNSYILSYVSLNTYMILHQNMFNI